VLEISENAFIRQEVAARCDTIPRDFLTLEAEWLRFAPLYSGTPQTETEDRLTWSTNAVGVYNAVAVLRKAFTREEIEHLHDELTEILGQGLGVQNQLAEISSASSREAASFIAPMAEITALDAPEFVPIAGVLRSWAELGVAERLLPPVAEFFVRKVLDPGNPSLLTGDRARDNVPAANDFLVWTRRNLGNVDEQITTATEITAIDDAIYRYVRELVDLEIASKGGGGRGSYFIRPLNAERAQSWRAFIDAVSAWNHVGQMGADRARSASTGVDAKMLADFAQQNARLEGLSRELRDA
jgi:hypothetical protein